MRIRTGNIVSSALHLMKCKLTLHGIFTPQTGKIKQSSVQGEDTRTLLVGGETGTDTLESSMAMHKPLKCAPWAPTFCA